jgi:hypothetical protein
MFAMGYGTDQCKVFNYWDRNPVIKVTGMESSWIVLNGAKEVMIILCDWDNGSSDVRIEAIGKQLGLPPDFVATNVEDPAKTYQATGGKLSLGPLKKHDFIAVRIKK